MKIYEADLDENNKIITSEKDGSVLAKYGITFKLPDENQLFITGRLIEYYSKFFLSQDDKKNEKKDDKN